MAEILLTSARFVKDATSISDNISGKYILTAIKAVQEGRFREICGSCLTDALKEMVADGSISESGNAAYKSLLDEAQEFLAFAVAAELCVMTSYKVANFGVVKTTDENAQTASFSEVAQMKDYYTFKADDFCRRLQRWILDNRSSFAELDECACGRIRANLRSAASCGVVLGGARGKILPGGGGCCR